MAKIMLVEDDASIVQFLCEYLRQEGFSVLSASGELQARSLLASESLVLLLVDLMLSDGDGFSVCRAAKERGLPVIFLTASGDENTVVRGLDMGADDYIPKPFRPRELVSRVKNILRRFSDDSAKVTVGSLTVDTDSGVVTKGGREIALSALEYRLLMLFVNNRGILLTRTRLLEDIWDVAGDFVNDNTLTVYIKRLREKIEDDPQNPAMIKTVRGLGYRMDK